MSISFPEIAAALTDAAFVIDRSDTILTANQLAIDAFQVNVVGLSFPAVFRSAAVAGAINDVRRSSSALRVEAEMYGKSPTLYGVNVSPLGSGGHLLITLRDLTDEQRVEKMRSDFIANASHEMRTPLSSIMGSIETLLGPAKNDSKARQNFLETMLSQANRMKRLIDDLLTLSRIELNEHVRPHSKIDLVEIAKQARFNLKSVADESGTSVSVDCEGPVFVRGDSEELLQVAQNLLENALKYGASGGRVVLACSQQQGRGLLRVQDFGEGIEPIHIPRLTERFYRVNTQKSRARGGTGLGLAIVKHIVARHHGRLAIASQTGQGSTFTVEIPDYKSNS